MVGRKMLLRILGCRLNVLLLNRRRRNVAFAGNLAFFRRRLMLNAARST